MVNLTNMKSKREVRMKTKLLLLALVTVLMVGCDSEEGLKEQTQIQSKEQIQAQNENLEEWSAKLTADLDKRRSFISAVEGDFEGQFSVEQSSFSISMKIVPTIPDYDADRTRTLAELEYELQNLNLNIHVVQWNPDSNMSAVGCVIENVKPDLKKGILNIIASGCSNSYSLFLSDDSGSSDFGTMSTNIANLVRNGQIRFVQEFKGKLKSSTNGQTYEFNLNRI